MGVVYGVTHSRTRLKRLSMHACIGEGNGNPLLYSCLENPRDRGAWWAAFCGVAQSQTRLKRLSSSSKKVWRVLKKKEQDLHLLLKCFPSLFKGKTDLRGVMRTLRH